MADRPSLTSGQLDTARRLLAEALKDAEEIGLSDAARRLYNAAPNWRDRLTGPIVSRLLRQLGFDRSGWIGTGYDRTPGYRLRKSGAGQ